MTYPELVEIALTLPDIEEHNTKKECNLVCKGGHIARLREKGAAVAFRLPWETIDEKLSQPSDLYFVTDHYRGWPYLLAWLDRLSTDEARELLQASRSVAEVKLPLRRGPKL